MPNQNAEQKARDLIDQHLELAGWPVQDYANINLSVPAFAVREFQMAKGHGKADYLLYVNRKVVGVVEAKPEGTTLAGVETQTEKYSEGLPIGLPAAHRPLPFLYQSTGVETCFTNLLDPDPTSRDVFTFHRPDTLWHNLPAPAARTPDATGPIRDTAHLQEQTYNPSTLLRRLRNMPDLDRTGMRDCQADAIVNLEQSLADNRRRAKTQDTTHKTHRVSLLNNFAG